MEGNIKRDLEVGFDELIVVALNGWMPAGQADKKVKIIGPAAALHMLSSE